ncbi:MAG: hypothetical protein ACREP5_17395, partial [Candidatus Binatia bacterium]
MSGKSATAFFIVLLLVTLVHRVAANAGVPTEQVRGTVDRVLAILQDPKLKSKDKVSERREMLRRVIEA